MFKGQKYIIRRLAQRRKLTKLKWQRRVVKLEIRRPQVQHQNLNQHLRTKHKHKHRMFLPRAPTSLQVLTTFHSDKLIEFVLYNAFVIYLE
ncbi:hypothetical protein WALSEDRAFT_54942, partial [Wallemia mellicola CBS 633.66]